MGSDFKRTLMWVILCAACFMLWDNWQVYNGQPSFFGGSATQSRSRVRMRFPTTRAAVPKLWPRA